MNFRLPQILLLSILACSPVAHAVERLDWEGLVPSPDASMDPYSRLDPQLQRDFHMLWNTYRLRQEGLQADALNRLEKSYRGKIEAAGADPDLLLAEKIEYESYREALEHKMVETLDGKRVSIAGYLLPIEFAGDKIVEFMLVPTIGACIHTPPPPANQMIHVRLRQGIDDQGLFAPVQVTGLISTGYSSQSIGYIDGQLDVESGYSMRASAIEAYDADPSTVESVGGHTVSQ